MIITIWFDVNKIFNHVYKVLLFKTFMMNSFSKLHLNLKRQFSVIVLFSLTLIVLQVVFALWNSLVSLTSFKLVIY